MNKTIRSTLFISIFLISSDIFLAIEFSGATVRASQILFLLLFILWTYSSIKSKRFVIPREKLFIPMFLFCFSVLLSLLNSEFILKTSIYFLWALFNTFMIIYIVQYAKKSLANLDWLIKVYLYSFVFAAAFGLYQLLSSVIFGQGPLITQWWKIGTLARINGFNFEPTFFANYMIAGAAMWFILWFKRSSLIKYKFVLTFFLFAVIIASSARSGWIGIAIIVFAGILYSIFYSIKNSRMHKQGLKLIIIVAVCLVIAIPLIIIYFDKLVFLLAGTGLFGEETKSYSLRFTRILQTMGVFKDHPVNWFIGVGLGAIGAYMINRPDQFGIGATSFEGIWSIEPSNVATEALAGMGIIGFVIGAWLLVYIALRLWRISFDSRIGEKYRVVSQSLLWSFILQILILQFNATFLRPYIWFHMGLCIAMVHCMEHYFIKNSSGENITPVPLRTTITGNKDT